MGCEINKDFCYKDEPTRFDKNNLEKFVNWAVEMNTSYIFIQSENNILCEIQGKIKKVTERSLSNNEVVDLLSAIYQGDGDIANLNGGEYLGADWNWIYNFSGDCDSRINCSPFLKDNSIGYQITIDLSKYKVM